MIKKLRWASIIAIIYEFVSVVVLIFVLYLTILKSYGTTPEAGFVVTIGSFIAITTFLIIITYIATLIASLIVSSIYLGKLNDKIKINKQKDEKTNAN
ncbi:hypothetical protein NPA07_01095 [Mycoplasmopsis caviae]|nr:hypothetical protein [Mycoplasmopsis caviae]UUD35455.1 hypothetical protein NPA07_01095 [Mycoplasmopsis caviae]